MTRVLVTVSLCAAVALPVSAASSFHFGNTRFQPTDSIAFMSGDDPAKQMTIIALTDFKIDRDDVLAAIDPGSSLYQQAGNAEKNVVFVRLSKPGKCGLSGYLGKTAEQIDLGDSFTAKMTTSTNAKVTGSCATTSPGKMFDDAYDFNLSFDAPITAIPKPATLAAGGGEPGGAYSALVKAIQSKDWNVASVHLEEESVRNGKPSDLKEYFYAIGLNYPKQATVTGGQMKGDRALIQITGIDHEDQKIHGAVEMKKVKGNWRVVGQSMYVSQ